MKKAKKIKNNNCEICNTKDILTDIHHIKSKSKEGENELYNKAELCPNCHRLVHQGKIIFEGRFLTTDCKLNETELIWRVNNESSITNIIDPSVYKYKGKII